ncbi:MAG: MBL fold metallo-hydrolase [Methanomicrobiales archaeon]|nr:MBL fold metallo-hydrolase [Methanomicrobiales archaeon]
MRVMLLGTGDAAGTPKAGCICQNCQYALEHDVQRLRTSLLIENEGHYVLIDSGPDLRRQLIEIQKRFGSLPKIDAVIWTHGHFDHFMGFGEFYRVQKIPHIYGTDDVMDYCTPFFSFLVSENKQHRKKPYEPFELIGLTWTLVQVTHPPTPTYGVVIEPPPGADQRWRMGYTSDTNRDIPKASYDLFTGLDLLFIDGIFPNEVVKVEKHLNYEEAMELAQELDARSYYIVHMSHYLSFNTPHAGHDGDVFEL